MVDGGTPPGYRRLFAEMRRRQVFRVAGVYGATAFVVLQVTELLGQGLRLPDTFLTVVTVLAIVCFPIALVLAWAFERTPDGITRTDMLTSGEVDELAALPVTRRWPGSGLRQLPNQVRHVICCLGASHPASIGYTFSQQAPTVSQPAYQVG